MRPQSCHKKALSQVSAILYNGQIAVNAVKDHSFGPSTGAPSHTWRVACTPVRLEAQGLGFKFLNLTHLSVLYHIFITILSELQHTSITTLSVTPLTSPDLSVTPGLLHAHL